MDDMLVSASGNSSKGTMGTNRRLKTRLVDLATTMVGKVAVATPKFLSKSLIKLKLEMTRSWLSVRLTGLDATWKMGENPTGPKSLLLMLEIVSLGSYIGRLGFMKLLFSNQAWPCYF